MAGRTLHRLWGLGVPLALLGLGISACSGEDDPTPPQRVEEGDRDVVEQTICAQLEFANTVDEALCPRVQEEGLEPRFASSTALCRRLSIDLNGRTPSWSEVQAHCVGHTPEQMVDHFMAQPEYIKLAQRRWADLFEYNDGFTHYRHIVRLDDLVSQLYKGEVDYEAFGIEALSSPAYAGRFFGEARVAKAFQIFLGRDAHRVEREDMVGLWMMWIPVQDFDTDYYFQFLDVRVFPAFCQPPLDELLCHSSLYGDHTVSIPLRNPDNQNDFENFIRPEELSEEEWEVLRTPGYVVTGLPFYQEHAVVEVMDRYLGWESSRALPEVREALTARFVEGGLDVRALERELLTSALYLQRNDPPEGELDEETGEAPAHRYSRVKLMEVETWLDSFMQAVQRDFGHCDHRFPFVRNGFHPGENRQVWAPNDYPKTNGQTNQPDMTYTGVARALGGCPDRIQMFRFTGTGVIHALDQEAVVQFLCYLPESSGLLPGGAFGGIFPLDDSEESRAALYQHQTRSFLSREATGEEIEDFLGLTQPCLDSGECEVEALPSQLCTALVSSAEFLHY